MRQWIDLGVNVDHVATLRQARGTVYPDPVQAAMLAEQNGADGITIHLREDRRHIQDRDVSRMMESIETRVNLEMAITPEMLSIACAHKPFACCLVPEKREELTTEGGLDVRGQQKSVTQAVQRLSDAGIRVSLFIDPDPEQIQAAADCGAAVVELHTGDYAEARGHDQAKALTRIRAGAERAAQAGLLVHAGHGLHYHNTAQVAAIPPISELNIGHAIIARAVMVGLPQAVRDIKALMLEGRELA
ncbi:pyridoxine 5-phosphate synthase [Natronospira proteinivora]|uniref:Pyridoxine 5'-phosphate synthase n=1 Tax=Natronospira proteinivora TaxID=1807133 RepID=A0ABT1G5V5_9GAMM|nr:pyridoxine 5'-phosphate synthase [Natronospira proteinivora]MCP1726680.1 pyridoxine 5-phosphate synthase [Natronospira proteinivora]